MFIKPKERTMTYLDSFIIGIAQALSVLPAISRSGATIATGMMLGNKKSEIAKFSFLMVLVPIIGANILEMTSGDSTKEGTSFLVIAAGFLVAFISGYLACKWMINVVKKGNLKWFAVYCILIGIYSILLGLHVI
jgi:undecaprenyl-diphosphatase